MGYPHPDYLLDVLTSEQISEWQAYDQLEPIGSEKEDFRLAQLCAIIVNTARMVFGKAGTSMVPISDFIPNWTMSKSDLPKEEGTVTSPGPVKQTLAEMKQAVLAIAKMFGPKKKPPTRMVRTSKPKSRKKRT